MPTLHADWNGPFLLSGGGKVWSGSFILSSHITELGLWVKRNMSKHPNFRIDYNPALNSQNQLIEYPYFGPKSSVSSRESGVNKIAPKRAKFRSWDVILHTHNFLLSLWIGAFWWMNAVILAAWVGEWRNDWYVYYTYTWHTIMEPDKGALSTSKIFIKILFLYKPQSITISTIHQCHCSAVRNNQWHVKIQWLHNQ